MLTKSENRTNRKAARGGLGLNARLFRRLFAATCLVTVTCTVLTLGSRQLRSSITSSRPSSDVAEVPVAEAPKGPSDYKSSPSPGAWPSRPDLFSYNPGFEPRGPTSNVTAEDIKVIAFLFPQFHPFPENDRIWKVNFTEWDNVWSIERNQAGAETIRPSDELGYYNLLDYDVRKQMGKLVNDHGIHGLAIHHYWFGDHVVMDGVLTSMLKDGEPAVNFFLNWANEAWTANWNGQDGKDVLLAQDYGDEAAWRTHFEWMLPYFQHEKYIKVEGRPVLGIYRADHMGHHFAPMMKAFRRYAEEAGFPPGGLEIMQSNWSETQEESDSIYNFLRHSSWGAELTEGMRRRVPVQHRGAMVGWDNSPRHSQKLWGASHYLATQPEQFYQHIVDLGESILADPNPREKENFMFINALNEWGEGNVLEPSKQYGDRHIKSLKHAIDYLRRPKDIVPPPSADMPVDTCFAVRTFAGHGEASVFHLRGMLESLQKLNKPNWAAVVFVTDSRDFPEFALLKSGFGDSRVTFYDTPKELISKWVPEDAGYTVTDHVLERMKAISPACASAHWLIATNGDNIYRPDALDHLDRDYNMMGLNFMSRWNQWNRDRSGPPIAQDQRCDRLTLRPATADCIPSGPAVGSMDLGALVLSQSDFRQASVRFSSLTASHPLAQDGAMAALLVSPRHKFRYRSVSPPPSESCQLLHNPSYASCRTAGGVWVDSPIFEEQECVGVNTLEGYLRTGMFDLLHFKKHGTCIRFGEAHYKERVEWKAQRS
ncbi:hypothetical protein HKX48_009504 [Thoreauomyces humboldtii]|nr:hypothetical protein HKX48_009504 [Thoreauomyces humboldtii]